MYIPWVQTKTWIFKLQQFFKKWGRGGCKQLFARGTDCHLDNFS